MHVGACCAAAERAVQARVVRVVVTVEEQELVGLAHTQRLGDEQPFERVVVDASAEPACARELVDVAGDVVANVHALDHPARAHARVVVAQAHRAQLAQVVLALKSSKEITKKLNSNFTAFKLSQ